MHEILLNIDLSLILPRHLQRIFNNLLAPYPDVTLSPTTVSSRDQILSILHDQVKIVISLSKLIDVRDVCIRILSLIVMHVSTVTTLLTQKNASSASISSTDIIFIIASNVIAVKIVSHV